MISGITFDPVSRLRAFPYDHFKIYTIGLIYPSDRGRNRPGSISIWSSRVWTLFETTGTIGTIIWKPGFSDIIDTLFSSCLDCTNRSRDLIHENVTGSNLHYFFLRRLAGILKTKTTKEEVIEQCDRRSRLQHKGKEAKLCVQGFRKTFLGNSVQGSTRRKKTGVKPFTHFCWVQYLQFAHDCDNKNRQCEGNQCS